MGDISKDIQSKFPDNKIKAIINIKYTANWLNSRENEFFSPFGISPQQFNILRILRGAKKAMKVQKIKERMIERSPNVTRLTDKLFDKNLIERIRCKEDRRVVYVNISKEGLKLLSDIDLVINYDFLNDFTEEEAKQLSDLLDKIRV